MKLTPPKKIVFLISLILVIISIVAAQFVFIPFVTVNSYWILLVGYILLAAGVALKGF